MNKKIDEMSKEEQYREYLRAHSSSEYDYAEKNYIKEKRRSDVERERYDLAEKKREKKHSNKREKKKKSYIKRIVAALLLIVILVITFFFSLTSKFERRDIGNRDYGIDSTAFRDLKQYRNILILGSDARESEGYDGSRTDAIVILSINKKNGDMKLISLMRDSYLYMKGYGGDEYVLSKATHAHAYDGAMNTVSMVNRNLDLNVREYMLFNWEAVSKMIDALGGIEIDVKEDEISDVNDYGYETARNVGTDFTPLTSPGNQTLTGVQAATYCRIRKNSGGDVSRGERYKKVIQAVITKGIKNPFALKKASKEVFPMIRTNMSNGNMASLAIRLGRSKSKVGVSWPNDYYGGILYDGLWYAVPTTLESNVKWLYGEAFGIYNHEPSETCREISQKIEDESGL